MDIDWNEVERRKREKLRQAKYGQKRRNAEKRREKHRASCREAYRRKRAEMMRKGLAKVVHLAKDEIDYIRNNPRMKNTDLANYIGCTPSTVRYHKLKFGTTKRELREKGYV